MRIQTSVRVEDKFYREAKKVFDAFGMSFGDATNIFLAKVAMEKRFPFDLSITDELSSRIENIDNNRNSSVYKDTKELAEDLGI